MSPFHNAAVGERSTLNGLYGMMKTLLSGNFAHRAAHAPDYVDFRRGDVRHSQADISKVTALLRYVPTHPVNNGMREAVDASVQAHSYSTPP